MSGTSLDGVDVASCQFELKRKQWYFSIDAAQTFKYSNEWRNKLATAHLLSGEKLIELHTVYGKFLGELCNQFIRKENPDSYRDKPDFIASHGHTIFHQPKNKFTFQLGDGNAIHAATHLPTVFDFRSLDVALGGEGAPLVPIGDQLLFSDYDVCLNLGGIANVSLGKNKKRIAFDVCYCNMALNYISSKIGEDFDDDGKFAAKGRVDAHLLNSFHKKYSRFREKRPSLGREGFEKDFQPLLETKSISLVNDELRTVCESIANEIALAIPTSKKKIKILATGGGAHNSFLIQLLQQKLPSAEVIVPEKKIVDFKEALVFAFLGVLRTRNEINVLKSVTKASKDSCSGILIG